MLIAETRLFDVGPYTVQQKPRFDNPAFAVYIVFRGDKLIGKSFSIPDLGCCEWLERDQNYAPSSVQPVPLRLRGAAKKRKGGRLSREESERQLEEALSSS